jgi:carboxypeptidase C (cathepsin A)
MRHTLFHICAGILSTGLLWGQGTDSPKEGAQVKTPPRTEAHFKPEATNSTGTVTFPGGPVDYEAVAGTLVVHPKGWDDAAAPEEKEPETESKDADKPNPNAEASMFYAAYFKRGEDTGRRPVTFLFNGGPGSSTVWLHMGAFGPRRVVTADDSHTPAAPYQVVNNEFSLLDVSDLVFVDAPGTGFSRIAGKDKEKSFYGVDPDAHAFAEFIAAFLSKYGRWNTPKYLFGESYGTTRSAVLVNLLETEYNLDFNGVILLSQILNFDIDIDEPEGNPGIDLPYVLALPSYTATAWYHHKLPTANPPAELEPLLKEVEAFAMNDYARALDQGSALPDQQRTNIAEKLHEYTGLSISYILKARLRIDGGEFDKNLQDDTDTTTGRLDTRFSGPTIDPLSKKAEYDPQEAAISSAYVSAFNDYVRRTLRYGQDKTYRPAMELWKTWNYKHRPPGATEARPGAANTMPDLANAMKFNPGLKILLTGGYFDLATLFYQGIYEMRHLQMPAKLQDNIRYRYYKSGHMVYAHLESLKALHQDVAEFIRATDNLAHK